MHLWAFSAETPEGSDRQKMGLGVVDLRQKKDRLGGPRGFDGQNLQPRLPFHPVQIRSILAVTSRKAGQDPRAHLMPQHPSIFLGMEGGLFLHLLRQIQSIPAVT